MRCRLALLMFLLYAVPGAWMPLFSVRLTELRLTPGQIGWVCATSALAALVAPLAAGQVADRWLPAERCLACCGVLGGLLLWTIAGLTEPAALFWTCLAAWLVLVPASTLSNAICFTHLSAPEQSFGGVRLWGTVGWVVPGLLLGCWFSDPAWLAWLRAWIHPEAPRSELADALRLAGLLALLLGLYALTLPHTPPTHWARAGRAGTSWLAPLAAVRLLRQRPLAVYCVGALGLFVTFPFSLQTTPLLLQHLGVPRWWLTPTMTLGQSMEVVTLGLLPLLLLRLGMRGTMILGLLAWVIALSVLTLGGPLWLVVPSLALNGVCVCCFVVAGQVFINGQARGDIRASAQALLVIVNGAGMLAGNLLAGWVRELAGGAFSPTFGVAAAIAGVAWLVFVAGFAESSAQETAVSLRPELSAER